LTGSIPTMIESHNAGVWQ